MHKEISKFITTLEEAFDFDKFEEDDDKIVLHANLGEIKINIDVNSQTFDIYMDFCYPIDCYNENFENEISETNQNIFAKLLEENFKQTPTEEFDCGYGCPFDATLLGYWDNTIDINIVKKFMDTFDDFNKCNSRIRDTFSLISEKLRKILLDKGYKLNEDTSFINNENTMIIATRNIPIEKKYLTENKAIKIGYSYSGQKYFLVMAESNDKVASIDNEHINDFLYLCEKANCSDDIEMFSDFKEILYFRTTYFHAIALLNSTNFDYQGFEYMYLMKKFEEFKPFKTEVRITDLNFSALNDSQFERLCYDLLDCMGFVDIHPVGKTNAADGGKDIIVTEIVKGLFGDEKRKWIFQCKNSKTSLGRKDVSEIEDLLKENGADKYGLFCSSDLTPSAVDRLIRKRLTIGEKIEFWGKIEMQSLLMQFPKLLSKYKLL